MADRLTRGDIMVCAPPGDCGKPRPSVILQADAFLAERESVTLCLVTTTSIHAPLFRTTIAPGKTSGLLRPSFAMADKIMTVSRQRLRQRLGRLSDEEMRTLDAAVGRWLGLVPLA